MTVAARPSPPVAERTSGVKDPCSTSRIVVRSNASSGFHGGAMLWLAGVVYSKERED